MEQLRMIISRLQPYTLVFSVALIGIMSIFCSIIITSTTHAAPITDFKAGRIIEDTVFTNSTSMNPQQIQSFLNSKNPTCDTNGLQRSEMNNSGVPDYNGNGSIQRWEWGKAKYNQTTFPCLKDYTEGGRVAAQIIYDVSQAYTINPQVLIVLLQKEQSLVTDTWPSVIQYRSATGYGCPDTAACDSQYYGLTNQLTWAAKMFRAILNNSPGWYTPYNLGNNFIRWSPVSSCGGSTVYIENRSTQALYNYTPYQPNASALAAGYGMGDGCGAYGNRNFYLYFRDWFGYNAGPAAFTVSGSSTIYLPIEGYKMSVPYMAAMHDYGISADSVQVVSQAYADSRPTPPQNSGLSAAISHVVKSPDDADEDGGSLYLISRGKRYQFISMAQFFSFGFKESEISFLPLSYIFSLGNGGQLSNFISSPYGSLFKLENNKKRLIFEYQTYINQNPSDATTQLSYYLADRIPSGTPITDKPVLIQQPNSGSVTLYQNDTYYGIPDYGVLSCWGLNSNFMGVPTYKIAQSDYVPIDSAPPLSCLVNDGLSKNIMNNTTRLRIPSSNPVVTLTLSQDLKNLAQKMPVRSSPVSVYVKTPDNAAVWFVEGMKKRVIPSYTAFVMMGLNDSNVDFVPEAYLSSLVDSGIKLAEGQLVKTSDNASVYVLSDTARIVYDSSSNFELFKNDWSKIETYNRTDLDKNYPDNGSRVGTLLVNKTSNDVYLMNTNACYLVSQQTLGGIGKTVDTLKQAQTFNTSIIKSINLSSSCMRQSTLFIKEPSNSLVYWLDGGQKRALTTYAAMLNKNNNISPSVMTLEAAFISSIPTGTPISQ